MPSTFLDNIKYYSHLIARPPSVARPTLESSVHYGPTEISMQTQIEDSTQSELQGKLQFASKWKARYQSNIHFVVNQTFT